MRETLNQFWNGKLVGRGALAIAVAAGSLSCAPVRASDEEVIEEQVVVVTTDSEGDKEKKVVEVRVPKLWLGIMLKSVEGDLARYLGNDNGILVDSVYPESPAAAAGLKVGDIIQSAGDVALSEPSSLLKVMSKLDEENNTITLTLSRQGEVKTVDVKAAARPEMEELVGEDLEELHIELKDLKDAEGSIKEALSRLHNRTIDKDVNILRFGSPSMVIRRGEGVEVDGDMEIVIKKDVEGEEMTVSVVRKDDEPAVITVTQDGEEKTYSVDELSELPENISVTVERLLDGQHNAIIGGRVHVIGSDLENIELGNINPEEMAKKAKELAEKYRETAAKRSREIAERASRVRTQVRRTKGDLPEDLKELHEMVNALKKEVAELKAQLKEKE